MNICKTDRPDCPAQFVKQAIDAYRERNGMSGAGSTETVITCTLCKKNRGWRRDEKGNERLTVSA